MGAVNYSFYKKLNNIIAQKKSFNVKKALFMIYFVYLIENVLVQC